MELTNKIALDAAITALRNLRDNGLSKYELVGTDSAFAIDEIIYKLTEMHKNENGKDG